MATCSILLKTIAYGTFLIFWLFHYQHVRIIHDIEQKVSLKILHEFIRLFIFIFCNQLLIFFKSKWGHNMYDLDNETWAQHIVCAQVSSISSLENNLKQMPVILVLQKEYIKLTSKICPVVTCFRLSWHTTLLTVPPSTGRFTMASSKKYTLSI